ncbi:hypothetical protein AAVH_18055 [Aphelenchoides avenae]|nr:hypothetical protein AAVH_18055 [Aphelenchus avenae]
MDPRKPNIPGNEPAEALKKRPSPREAIQPGSGPMPENLREAGGQSFGRQGGQPLGGQQSQQGARRC